jgi:hypothetical protein
MVCGERVDCMEKRSTRASLYCFKGRRMLTTNSSTSALCCCKLSSTFFSLP